jgi:hypothetical protein
MFSVAQSYIERGWSVIPLCGKKPAVPWKQSQERPATLGEIAHWFGAVTETRYNIGVVTGAVSGVTVVDCDTREDAVWWWKNRTRTGLISVTGRGVHFWYAYAPIRNLCHFEGHAIDVRGDGGYVVAPPSLHPSGKPYEWKQEGELAEFDPEWFAQNDLPGCASSRGVGGTDTDSVARDVRDVDAYLACIESVQNEGGSRGLIRACAVCRDAGMSEAEAMQKLMVWNVGPTVQPPWSMAELGRAVTRTFRR